MSNYIFSSVQEMIVFLQHCQERYPNRVFVTGATLGREVSAPNKRRKHYTYKMDHIFAPECFVDNGVKALLAGDGFYVAHIPKEHINPEFLEESHD